MTVRNIQYDQHAILKVFIMTENWRTDMPTHAVLDDNKIPNWDVANDDLEICLNNC